MSFLHVNKVLTSYMLHLVIPACMSQASSRRDLFLSSSSGYASGQPWGAIPSNGGTTCNGAKEKVDVVP